MTVDILLLTVFDIRRPALSSERVPSKGQDSNSQIVTNIWSGLDIKTDRLTDRQSQCDSDSASAIGSKWEFQVKNERSNEWIIVAAEEREQGNELGLAAEEKRDIEPADD
jgi:hypothetical protein